VGFGVPVRQRSSISSVDRGTSSAKDSKSKKNPLGGLFAKPSKAERKEEEKPVTNMDKRQKEQKKKLEAELAKREQEKQKKDKEMKHILRSYLEEQLNQSAQSRMKAPLGMPTFEGAPPLIPRVFVEASK
jgi:DNA-binding PucR family transcriptional regulator